MADGAFSFVSWVRRGLATAVAAVDDGTEPGPESYVYLEIQFNEAGSNTNAAGRLRLVGPGDIVGLDSSVVCRTWPHSDDLDAEYIPYPLIEFDQADLPWRYSPAQAKRDDPDNPVIDQLRPWFSLVVLAKDDCSLAPSTSTQKLPVLSVSNLSALPSQTELWAWAHTQFEGSNLDEGQARSRITGAPGLFTARLMSPRLLQPNTEYLACLVPTFERGRLVGIGKDPGTRDALDGWDMSGSGTFTLPVYYHWRFRTGTVGDFEQVARLIQPYDMPETLGFRDMNVKAPGFGLPGAADDEVLPVEGALMSLRAAQRTVTWPDTKGNEFIAALANLINSSVSGNVPKLVPPLYAQWYAAATTLESAATGGTNPPWFRQLNVDPRNRVAAAAGTKVIQREQQALLASGWDQVEEIAAINDQLRVLQLTRELLTQLYARNVKTLSIQRFYQVTARLHAQVTCGDNSVCYNIQNSPIIPGFFSTQWLRWTRTYGPIGRVQGRPGNDAGPDLIDRLNDGRKPATDPEPREDLTPTPDLTGGIPCELVEQLVPLGSEVLLRWSLLILWVTRKLLVQKNGQCWWIGLKALKYANGLIRIAISGADVVRRCELVNGTTTIAEVADLPPQPASYDGPLEDVEDGDPLALPHPPGSSTDVDSEDAAAIRVALEGLIDIFTPPPSITPPTPMDIAGCHATLTATLEPELTVQQVIGNRLYIDPELMWTNPKDSLQPVLVQPSFERPMYKPLKEISNDWILPGLDGIPRNSVGLAVLNQRFVEAYMAGLNHEMTREFLWNEFPTDQRCTYFRQFWDVAGCNLSFGSAVPDDAMKDIMPLRLWANDSDLGENSPRPIPAGDQPFLVLVVRAQLIEKYPNVIVYAQKVVDGTLTEPQEHPMFFALLEPDVAFYGFKFTEAFLRADPSWYFVLQEQPGDPKFADPAKPSHSSAGYTAASSQGQSSGVIAEKTFLQPFRLAIQASTLLPPQQS